MNISIPLSSLFVGNVKKVQICSILNLSENDKEMTHPIFAIISIPLFLVSTVIETYGLSRKKKKHVKLAYNIADIIEKNSFEH
jgi:hypothetical protein